MSRQTKNIDEALKNYSAIKQFEGLEAFKLIIEPLKKELDGLKHAYKLKVEDAKRFDGYYEGLKFVLDLLDAYKIQGELAYERQDKLRKQLEKENEEIDSTNL